MLKFKISENLAVYLMYQVCWLLSRAAEIARTSSPLEMAGVRLFFACGLLLFSQNAFSQITANPDSGCAPLAGVQFTAPPGSTNWQWNFDDGTSSNAQNPVHGFASPRVYNVTFTGT